MISKTTEDAFRAAACMGSTLPQPIIGYHADDEGHWVAQLACGHNQHVRHDPPLVRRDWVQSEKGRASMVGFQLGCKKCVEGAPTDERPPVEQPEKNS